jgi:aspartyl-tRNA(Asn)/glutamyl-tRNA(Gln) amidotransferase subunit B
MWDGEGRADGIIESRGLRQMSDSGALEEAVDKVLAENPDQVEQYRAGKTKVMGFLVGQVMKASGGKANPRRVSELMKSKLEG